MASVFQCDDTFLETYQRSMKSATKPTSLDEALQQIKQMLDPGSSNRAPAIDYLGEEYLADPVSQAPRNMLQELNNKIADFQGKLATNLLGQPVNVGLPRQAPKVVPELATYNKDYAVIIFVWTLQDPPVYTLVQKIAADVQGRSGMLETTVLPFVLYLSDALHALPEEFQIKHGIVRRAQQHSFLTSKGIEVRTAVRFNKDDKSYRYLFQAASKFDADNLPSCFLDLSNPEDPGTVFEIETTPQCPAYDIEAFSDFTGANSEAEVLFPPLSYWYIKDDVKRENITINGTHCNPEIVRVKGVQAPVCDFCDFKLHEDQPHLHYAQCGCRNTPAAQHALKDAMDNDDVDTVLKLYAANLSQTDSSGTSLCVWAAMRRRNDLIDKMEKAGFAFDWASISIEVQKRRIGVCPRHPENHVLAWCNTCNEPVCHRCYDWKGVHKDHVVASELKECFLEHENDFSESLQLADEKLKCLKDKSAEEERFSCEDIECETTRACAGIDESLAKLSETLEDQNSKADKDIAVLEAQITELKLEIDKNKQQLKKSQEEGEETKRNLMDRKGKTCEIVNSWNQGVISKSDTGAARVKTWRQAFQDGRAAESPTDGSVNLPCLEALRAFKETKLFLAESQHFDIPVLPAAMKDATNEAKSTLEEFQGCINAAVTQSIESMQQKSLAFLVQKLKQSEEVEAQAESCQVVDDGQMKESPSQEKLDAEVETLKRNTKAAAAGMVVSASGDGTLKVWGLDSGTCTATLSGHSRDVVCVQACFSAGRAISGSADGTLKVWCLTSGTCTATLSGHSNSVRCVSADFSAGRAISGSADETLKVWCLTSGTCTATLSGHSNSVLCVSADFSAGRAISGSWDRTLKVWCLTSGTCTATLKGYSSYVRCVSADFSAGRAISGSEDQTLKVWCLTSGTCTATLTGHTEVVYGLSANFA